MKWFEKLVDNTIEFLGWMTYVAFWLGLSLYLATYA
jgi:hypothetical protein